MIQWMGKQKKWSQRGSEELDYIGLLEDFEQMNRWFSLQFIQQEV
jgi:hypothetical protein